MLAATKKPASLTRRHGLKFKNSNPGRGVTKTRRKGGAAPGVASQEGTIREDSNNAFTDIIEKTAAKIVRQLTERISRIDLRNGPQVIDFHVIVNQRSIRVDASTITGSGIKAPSRGKAAGFNPREAGRLLVQEMQRAEGGAWSGAELKKIFALTSANLHKRRREHRIISWRDAKNQFYYPSWQFNHAGAMLPGVQEVLQTFWSADEWRVMRYFLAPRHQLDGRAPLDLLRAGEVEKVVAHAKANGEENSW